MRRIFLVSILFLALVLRVIALESNPVGFTADEASFGYDAYSLLQTGKDQWGNAWPITFKSFGDSKLPFYTYITMPTVSLLGLNEFATRLPSALFGFLAVFATYLLTRKLFKKDSIALISSFLLAISPWHIALSRGAFEANLTAFFMAFGAYAFLRGVKDKRWLVVSAVSFGINIFTYHSARLVTPLILAGLVYFYREEFGLKKVKDVKKVLKENLTPVLVFGGFLALALFATFSGGTSRAADITIFNPTDKWMTVFDRRYDAVFMGLPSAIARIFSNKILYLFDRFTYTYLAYFSPQYLFTHGASEWTYGMIPGRGVLYLFEIPFVLTGLWHLARKGFKAKKAFLFILFWLLISPIPASLTKGPGSAGNRASVMMPAIQIFSGFGAYLLYEEIRKRYKKLKPIFLKTLFVGTALIFLVFFLEDYFYHAPREGAREMLYGRKEAVEFTSKHEDRYDKIIFSRTLSEPQIFVAFYKKVDPVFYQKEAQDWLRFEEEGLAFLDQLGEYSLGKYVFKNINFYDAKEEENTLLVGSPREFPSEVENVKIIKTPNQDPAVIIYDPLGVEYAYKAI